LSYTGFIAHITMADFTISIDDSLVPGIIATASLEGISPEEVVSAYATSMATKVCQDLKVGPYYVGPTPPQFNPDGTPYDPNWQPPVVDAEPDGGDV
jgi:hypothetical protein